MTLQRILQAVPAKVDVYLRDQNGEPANASGAVTVGIARADGTALVAAGSSTTDEPETGRYSYQLSAVLTALLDDLRGTWSADGGLTTTTIEILGGFFYSVSEARASSAALADTDRFSNAQILAARNAVQTRCEDYCKRAFTPRYRRIRMKGSERLLLPDSDVRAVRSLSLDGQAYGVDDLNSLVIDEIGVLARTSGYIGNSMNSVIVGYEYGMDAPPQDLRDANLAHLRMVLTSDRSAIPARTETFNVSDGGTFRLSIPDGDHATGVAEIDEVYNRYRVRNPVVA